MTNVIGRPDSVPSLEDLLARVARGEQSMFGPFYEQVADRIFGLVKSVLRDPAQAEEVSQEILVELWRTSPNYSPEKGTVITWVMTVAHRRAVDRVRSEAASARRARHATFETCRSRPFDQVAETVVDADDHDRVRRCLGELTERQHESVRLAYYRGKTCQEIAEELLISVSTVKSRLHSAVRRLRACMRPTD